MTSLVLLPGLDGTGLLFRPLIDCLPKDIEPIVVSYPRHLPLGYQDLLPLVLSALPCGPFVLLGESFSGPLSIMVAATQPPGLCGVVLCATFVRSPAFYLPAWCSHLVRPFQFRLFSLVAHLRMMLGRFSDPTVRGLASEAASLVLPEVIARRIREVHRVNVAPQLSRCAVPVLYLRGSKDRLVPAFAMRQVVRANPATHVVTLHAPHVVLQAQPAEAAAAIAAFVAKL